MFPRRHDIEAPRLFPDRLLVINPWVVRRIHVPPNDFHFDASMEEGQFYRVVPSTAREVLFIQMLGKNVDVFLPREGEGLLIRRSALKKA